MHTHRTHLETRPSWDRGQQAAQVLSLLAELVDEIRGLHDYVDFLDTVLKTEFPEHSQLAGYTTAIVRRNEFYLHKLYKFQRQYQKIYDDYAHKNGKPELDRLLTLQPFMISINDLLERFPMDTVVKDFLDG